MLTFNKEILFTGIEKRVSQKTKNEYVLINYLGETGVSFSTMAECEVPSDLKQLDVVDVTFKLTPGKFFRFETIAIKKAI